jgi:hypothetical protein
MAYVTLGQKAHRVLLLMLAMRHPPISRAMRKRGFNEAVMAKGYQLLFALSAGRFSMADIEAMAKPLLDLDAWENLNYPIIFAALRHNHPEVWAVVFHNLSMTEGQNLIPSVKTLLERLAAQSPEVHATLADRGVTPEVLAEARGYLTILTSVLPSDDESIDLEADAAAEKALWDWYLEWGTIARTVIKNRRHLRVLGFLRKPSGEVVEAPLPNTPADEDSSSDEDQSADQRLAGPQETQRQDTEREQPAREDETQRTQAQQPTTPFEPSRPGRNEPPPFE